MILANGINDAWVKVVDMLSRFGKETSPRGHKIKEIKNLSVMIEDPAKRILSLPNRKASLPFAFGELVWYLSGRNDLEMMSYYSRKMKDFSDDGETLNSAYGYRIFGKHPMLPFNQWEHVVRQLKNDNDTRQAIIHIHTPNNMSTKDEVCTLSLQFLIREGKLDMVVNMRSNDIIWGFTYDVFSFTSMQELMANELGIEMGVYYHNAASMHIYEKDYDQLNHVNELYDCLLHASHYSKPFSYDGMTLDSPEMYEIISYESIYRRMNFIAEDETCEAEKARYIEAVMTNKHEGVVKEFIDVFALYCIYKNFGKEAVFPLLKYDNLHHCMIRNHLSGKKLMDSRMEIIEGPDGSGKTTYSYGRKQFLKGSQVIAFTKPDRDFDRMIYFHTALLSGDVILDRFYLSDLVYATHFRRKGLVNRMSDVSIIEKMLNYRKAKLTLLLTKASVCHQRLDEEDSKLFTYDDISKLRESYLINYRVCRISDKEILNQGDE